MPRAVIPARARQSMHVLEGNGEIIQALRKIPKLQAFDKKDLRKILSCSRILKYTPGETITREEEPDQRIYFIVSGKVRVTRHGVEIKVLARTGDVFGEMRLLSASGRTSSVSAVDETVCLVTDVAAMENLHKEDRVAFAAIYYMVMAEVLARRLKETSDELTRVRGELQRLKSSTGLAGTVGSA
ncbi:MAG: DNA-binding transcriptional dual regulator Crp [Syntrophaceae bacterium PtaB.Bin038]|nr:MAG: DNA-binding transcriptional dual regulator Crp [Syntrophaceae bacterium PtaB.Bin038]